MTFPASVAAPVSLKCALASGLQLLEGTGILEGCISAGTEKTRASSQFWRAGGGEKQKFVLENT